MNVLIKYKHWRIQTECLLWIWRIYRSFCFLFCFFRSCFLRTLRYFRAGKSWCRRDFKDTKNYLICRRNLLLMESLFIFLVCSLFYSITSQSITIFRNSTIDQGSLVNSIDTFNISSTQCANDVDICTTFGGTKLQDGCQCTCSEKNSTVGLYQKEWRCTRNSVVRQHTGKM